MTVDSNRVTSIFGNKWLPSPPEDSTRPAQLPLEVGSLERAPLVEHAKRIYDLRKCRDRYFPSGFFGEPAWDLMLSLYVEAGERPLSATGAAHVTGTPESTAIRWVDALEAAGLVQSYAHTSDKRLRLLALSSHGRIKMDQYLAEILRD